MIYNFKVENFCSIKDKQELDFTVSKKINDSIVYREKINRFICNINCILGGNASGKTNVLNALSFFL